MNAPKPGVGGWVGGEGRRGIPLTFLCTSDQETTSLPQKGKVWRRIITAAVKVPTEEQHLGHPRFFQKGGREEAGTEGTEPPSPGGRMLEAGEVVRAAQVLAAAAAAPKRRGSGRAGQRAAAAALHLSSHRKGVPAAGLRRRPGRAMPPPLLLLLPAAAAAAARPGSHVSLPLFFFFLSGARGGAATARPARHPAASTGRACRPWGPAGKRERRGGRARREGAAAGPAPRRSPRQGVRLPPSPRGAGAGPPGGPAERREGGREGGGGRLSAPLSRREPVGSRRCPAHDERRRWVLRPDGRAARGWAPSAFGSGCARPRPTAAHCPTAHPKDTEGSRGAGPSPGRRRRQELPSGPAGFLHRGFGTMAALKVLELAEPRCVWVQ